MLSASDAWPRVGQHQGDLVNPQSLTYKASVSSKPSRHLVVVCAAVHDMEVAAARPAPSLFGVYLDPIIVVDSLYEEKHEH